MWKNQDIPGHLKRSIKRCEQEAEIRRDRLYCMGRCQDCGAVERMHVRTTRCTACREKHRAEANRESQRARRGRETIRRRLAAGMMKVVVHGDMQIAVSTPFPCRHCGEPFRPKQSTARFCSARCRVAWHRAHRPTVR
jgi:hypothetical protein